MGSKESGQVAKIGYIQKIRRALLDDAKGLEQIITNTGLPRRYVGKFLNELKKNNEVLRKVDEKTGFIVWELTNKGKLAYSNNWTALQEDILDIIKRKGSYFRHSDQPVWPSQPLFEVPYVILDAIAYPSTIDTDLNTITLQYETKDFLKAKLLKAIVDSRKEFRENDKLIFSFEFDLGKYSDFIKSVKNFINDVKFDRDVLADENLVFKKYGHQTLELLEAYLDNSDAFADEEYKKKLEKLSKDTKFIKALMSFGSWASLLDMKTLTKLDALFKAHKEPLSDKELVRKLIIKTREGGFYMPLYDYLSILRILNHNDSKLKNKLLQYEEENRYRLDKSLVFKIQNEMRGKRK